MSILSRNDLRDIFLFKMSPRETCCLRTAGRVGLLLALGTCETQLDYVNISDKKFVSILLEAYFFSVSSL
jgi:hypothetical protein